jgi:hypothetical protein
MKTRTVLIVDDDAIIQEQAEVVKKTLKHLGLWKVKSRPPPRGYSPPGNFHIDYSDSQIPLWYDDQTSVLHPTYCVSHLPTKT